MMWRGGLPCVCVWEEIREGGLTAPFLGLMLLDHVRVAEVGWRQSQGFKPFL